MYTVLVRGSNTNKMSRILGFLASYVARKACGSGFTI